MSKVTRNIFGATASQLIILALGFVATRYIYRSLGDDVLGLLYFSFTFQTVIQQAAVAGVSILVLQQVAAHTKSDPDYVNDLVVTSFTLHLILSGLLAVIAWLIAPWLVNHWLNLHDLNTDTAILMLRILMCGTFISILAYHYRNILRGYEDIVYSNFVQVITLGLRQLGLIVLIYFGAGAVGIALWVVAMLGLEIVAQAWRVHRFLRLTTLPVPRIVRSVLQRNRRFGSDMMILSVVNVLSAQADKIVVSRLLPVGVLGYYSFLQNTIERSRFLSSSVGAATLPHQAAVGGDGDIEKTRRLHRMLVDLNMFGLTPIYAAVGLGLFPLLAFTFSADIARQLFMPSIMLTLSAYVAGTVTQSHQTAVALGLSHLSRRAYTISFLITVPTAILAIYYLGLAGAGIAYLIRQVVIGLLLLPPFYRICLDEPLRQWLPHYLQGILLAFGVYGAAFAAVYWLDSSLWNIGLVYSVATLLYVALAWQLISVDLRRRILETIPKVQRYFVQYLHPQRP